MEMFNHFPCDIAYLATKFIIVHTAVAVANVGDSHLLGEIISLAGQRRLRSASVIWY